MTPAERGPSGTGHDTAGCERHKGDPHNLCEECWKVEPPPVAVPGPASANEEPVENERRDTGVHPCFAPCGQPACRKLGCIRVYNARHGGFVV